MSDGLTELTIQNSQEPGEKRHRSWVKNAAIIFSGLILLFACIIGIISITLPDVSRLKDEAPQVTAMMQYREAQYKEKGRRLGRRYIWVPGKRISSYLRDAVLISEDDKFFQHEGFDWDEMRQAMEKNQEEHKIVRGGSTITQQLAKNIYLKPARTPWRKLREALIAREMEKKLSKWRILELYLNVIEWGDGIYGIEAAARSYYGKSAAELTPSESIRLASVIVNPHRYSALSNSSKRIRNKRLLLTERMFKRGLFDEATCQELREEFSMQ
jgi:monofunctional glycosyltransferase